MPDPVYQIRIHRCDNRLVFLLNGVSIYDRYVDNDPVLDDVRDITDELQPHPYQNVITVQGYNGPRAPNELNPWRFHYQILKDGEEVVGFSQGSSSTVAGQGQVFSNSHTIVKERPSNERAEHRRTYPAV